MSEETEKEAVIAEPAAAEKNPLATEPIGKLIFRYSIPAIISGLISSIYNIVDEMFIGWSSVGADGNGATTITYPIVMIMTTFAMLFGAGAASAFSLHLGSGKEDKAKSVIGSGITLTVLFGIIIAVIGVCAARPLLYAFGGRNTVDADGTAHNTLDLAVEYARIIVLAAPFAMMTTGASQYIRADGSPRYAMISTVAGAVLNCILDYIFVIVLNWGMSGAAWATAIGQIVSTILIVAYFFRFKSVKLQWRDLIPKLKSVLNIVQLGVVAGINQIAVTIVQIALNNVLGKYGELSVYGRTNVINAVGVISKVNSLFSSIIFGIAASTQPIIGYNVGNGNHGRAKKTFFRAWIIVLCVSAVAFLLFETIPKPLTMMFGKDRPDIYFEFAKRYFRIYLCAIVFAGTQILCAQFFPSIGKSAKGVVVALSRQFICLLPLIFLLPLIGGWGIDGVLCAGPIADTLSGTLSFALVLLEIRKWRNLKPEPPEEGAPPSEADASAEPEATAAKAD